MCWPLPCLFACLEFLLRAHVRCEFKTQFGQNNKKAVHLFGTFDVGGNLNMINIGRSGKTGQVQIDAC